LENITISALLMLYPEHWGGLVRIAAALTLTKFLGYAVGVAIAISGFFIKLVRRANPAKQSALAKS